MSVGVSVTCEDGVTLVTDSRRMAEIAGAEPRFEIASEEARKLFLVQERLAVATHGQAVIGEKTIGTLMEEFEAGEDAEASSYAQDLGLWFSQKLSEVMKPRRGDLYNAQDMSWPLGFVLGGFEGGVGRVYAVRVRAGDYRVELCEPSTDNPGVHVFGQSDGIDRLLGGIDRRALKEARIDVPADDQKLDLLAYDLTPAADLADAVEIGASLVGVQLLAQRLSAKTYASKLARIPGCGGPIQAIAVSQAGGRWVRPEDLSPQNPQRALSPQGAEVARRGQLSA